MMDTQELHRTALIACKDQLLSQSFEMIFEERGYSVERLASGKRALDVARRTPHDVILVDEGLEDLAGIQICRGLRDDPLFDHSTPIVLVTGHRIESQSRLRAFGAGAWMYCGQPVDIETLFLQLETFQRARQKLPPSDSEQAIEVADDVLTSAALQQVAGYVAARASRNHEPLACVALSTQADRKGRSQTAASERFSAVADVLRGQARKSDVVVRLGDSRLGIFAPGTDATGARRFVARLQRKLKQAAGRAELGDDLRLRAGICAVPDFAMAKVPVQELLHRAEAALDQIGVRNLPEPVLSFDDIALPSVHS